MDLKLNTVQLLGALHCGSSWLSSCAHRHCLHADVSFLHLCLLLSEQLQASRPAPSGSDSPVGWSLHSFVLSATDF
jgi:hypothetical protein